MAYEIRELSMTGVINQGIKVAVDHFPHLLGIQCLLIVPLGIAQAYLNPAPGDPFNPEVAPQAIAPEALGLFMIVTFLYIIAAVLANAAMVNSVAQAYIGQAPSLGVSFGRAFQRFFPILWTSLLVMIAIMGGFLLLIIPGIIAALWFALATQVVVLEPRSGFDAMKRSRVLMKGNMLKLIAIGLLVGIINFGIGMGCGMLGMLANSHLVLSVTQVLSTAITGIIGSAIFVVFYFSARCQHDHFDLDILAENIAGGQPEKEQEF